MTVPNNGKFALSDRGPLTKGEWEWVVMLRAIDGGRLPPLTLKMVQDMQAVLRNVAG